jgi:predicted transcriptional regulator
MKHGNQLAEPETVAAGKALMEARVAKGYSIGQLATALHMSKRTIWGMEHGKQGAYPFTIERLSRHLGIEPAALMPFYERYKHQQRRRGITRTEVNG